MRGAARRLAVAAATAMSIAMGVAGAQAQPLPAESAKVPVRTFFRHADLSGAKLSPSGRWLAVGNSPSGLRTALVVLDLEGTESPSVVAAFGDADVSTFAWVNDERLVFDVIDLQSGLGDQNLNGGGLFSVRRDGKEFRRLVRPKRDFLGERSIGPAPLEYNHVLLSVPRVGGEDVIVGEFAWDARGDLQRIHPIRVNTATGRSSALDIAAPDRVTQWLFDPLGEPRVAVRTVRGTREVLWRAPGQGAWKSLASAPDAEFPFVPVSVDRAGQLFVSSPGPRGQDTLRRFDFATGKPEEQPLVSAPGFDFDGSVVTDSGGTRALGVRIHTDAESSVWFDPAMRQVQAAADARFPGRINRISCGECRPGGPVLVFSYADQDPGSYWVHRPSENAWESVGRVRKDVEPAQMARLDLHRIRSRDGHDLPVWVTVPTGASRAPRPAVVLVHGGPWVRGGYWRWEADAQFLASRGYVVIEPEFRGSLGYGFAHFQRGWKSWGTTMQDDVADAMQWAVQKGLVDGRRVCIAGASYGGYSTLMSLVRHPDLFRCGVAWVAVADPRLLMTEIWSNDISREAMRWSLPKVIGDPTEDAAMLKAAAPVERAAEIKAPVMLAFGRRDRRVPLEHGTRMRDALRAAGRAPEWVVYDDEAHGWLKVENRVDFWQRVESFLDRNLR